MTSSHKTATLLTYIVVFALLSLSFALVVVASIPFLTLKPQLEALSLHGHGSVFTEGLHQRIVVLLRAAAAVPLVAAGAVFLFRRRISTLTASAGNSVVSFSREISQEAVDALRRDGRVHLVLLAATLLLAMGIRVFFLFQPMRYDEAYTYTHFAATPLYLTVSNYSSTNNHILNTLLVQFSTLLFGNHPWAIRLPALVAGWLLVPATYLVTRAYFNKHAALLSGALVASSSPLILFSTNARGYTMMALAFMVLLILAPYCLRGRSAAPWILFAVVTALGFYALPTMLYGFGIAAGWIMLTSLAGEAALERVSMVKRLVATSAGAAGLTLLLYSPVLLVFGTNMRNTDVLPQTWEKVLTGIPRTAISAWRQWNVAIPELLGGLLLLGLVLAVLFHSRVSRHRVSLALAAFLWIVPVVFIQRVVPYDRVWIFLLPLYFVLAAAGFSLVWNMAMPGAIVKRSEVLALIGLVLGVALTWNVGVTQSVYFTDDTGTLRDGEPITAWMKDNLKSGDIVLAVTPADGPLEYYFPRVGLRPADYWYSTQVEGGKVDSGRRVLAVVRDSGPDLNAVLEKAGLTPDNLSTPETLQRFKETSIIQMVAAESRS